MTPPTIKLNKLDYQIDIREQNIFLACCVIAIAFIACIVMQLAFGLQKGYGYPLGAIIFAFYIIMDTRQELKGLYLHKKQLHDSCNQPTPHP